jgi:hypothetical protein
MNKWINIDFQKCSISNLLFQGKTRKRKIYEKMKKLVLEVTVGVRAD